jgi:hypothetical protein
MLVSQTRQKRTSFKVYLFCDIRSSRVWPEYSHVVEAGQSLGNNRIIEVLYHNYQFKLHSITSASIILYK